MSECIYICTTHTRISYHTRVTSPAPNELIFWNFGMCIYANTHTHIHVHTPPENRVVPSYGREQTAAAPQTSLFRHLTLALLAHRVGPPVYVNMYINMPLCSHAKTYRFTYLSYTHIHILIFDDLYSFYPSMCTFIFIYLYVNIRVHSYLASQPDQSTSAGTHTGLSAARVRNALSGALSKHAGARKAHAVLSFWLTALGKGEHA